MATLEPDKQSVSALRRIKVNFTEKSLLAHSLSNSSGALCNITYVVRILEQGLVLAKAVTSKMKSGTDDKDALIKFKSIRTGPSVAESEDAPLAPLAPPNPVEVLLRIFCADSINRMEGRAGFAVPLVYKNPTTKASEKLYSVHLFHQMFVGSVGGVACGIETGYISFDRLPAPNTPFPPSWVGANELTQSTLRNWSVIWNATKRVVIAGLVFDLFDKHIEEMRGRQDWLNFSIAGAISGGIFGLRGGTRGLATCSLGFAFFGAMAGFFAYFDKRDQSD